MHLYIHFPKYLKLTNKLLKIIIVYSIFIYCNIYVLCQFKFKKHLKYHNKQFFSQLSDNIYLVYTGVFIIHKNKITI